MPAPDHGFDPSDVRIRRQFLELIALSPDGLDVLRRDCGGNIDGIILRCLAVELMETSLKVHELCAFLEADPRIPMTFDRPDLSLVPE